MTESVRKQRIDRKRLRSDLDYFARVVLPHDDMGRHGVARSIRKLKRAVVSPLAERASTKKSIALIIVASNDLGRSSGLAPAPRWPRLRRRSQMLLMRYGLLAVRQLPAVGR